MKKLFIAFFLMIISTSVYAQNWTKEIEKDFKKSKEVALEIDLSDCKIMGLSYEKFKKYYENKTGKDEEYVDILLEKFESEVRKNFFKVTGTKDNPNSQYKVVYHFNSISDNAGLDGTFYVDNNGNKSIIEEFEVKDGRWNDFEVLLMENAKKVFYYNNRATFTPFEVSLYKKSKAFGRGTAKTFRK